MNHIDRFLISVLLLHLPSAHAIDVLLDFSGPICGEAGRSNCNPGDVIGQSYGDLEGVLDVSYRTIGVATGQTTGTSLTYWGSGFSNLVDVAYASVSPSSYGELTFTPSSNYSMFLDSIDIGSNSAGALAFVGVYDSRGFPEYSTAFFQVSRFPHFDLLRFGYNKPLILRWGPASNVAVDNIKLSLTPIGPVALPVPEPTNLLLLTAGLALMALCRSGLATSITTRRTS